MKKEKLIKVGQIFVSEAEIDELVDKGELMHEEEYLEVWFYDFLRDNRKHCPGMLNDPYDEFGFLDKWPDVIPLMFPTSNTYVDSQYTQIYDVKSLNKRFPSYNSKNLHALNGIKKACRKYYTVEEYVNITNDISKIAKKVGINTIDIMSLEDVDEISVYYAKDGKDIVDMISSEEIIVSENIDEFFEDLLRKRPDTVLSLDLTEEVDSLMTSNRVTLRELLLDFYIKHGEVIELRSGKYLFS